MCGRMSHAVKPSLNSAMAAMRTLLSRSMTWAIRSPSFRHVHVSSAAMTFSRVQDTITSGSGSSCSAISKGSACFCCGCANQHTSSSCSCSGFSHARFMSSSAAVARSKSDDKLLRALQSELDFALKDAADEEDLPEGSVPFEIEDKPGEQCVFLKRKYGNEEITIEVMPMGVDDEGNEEEEENQDDEDKENDNQESQISMTVTVSKIDSDRPSLEFSLSIYPDEFTIDNVSVKPSHSDSGEQVLYDPPYEDLDENLQKAFHSYLEHRGINASLTNYISEYMVQKDSKEYINWLKNIKDFIEN